MHAWQHADWQQMQLVLQGLYQSLRACCTKPPVGYISRLPQPPEMEALVPVLKAIQVRAC